MWIVQYSKCLKGVLRTQKVFYPFKHMKNMFSQKQEHLHTFLQLSKKVNRLIMNISGTPARQQT